ncbi:hypothetical protein MBOU_28100 [Mycobacterium bourgelatii]|uniref:Uncharacterized protein n=1 Tax=Mycobacterium bourgelatii TaxID=1273442 RepID=A0A7I9YQ69_MYCBU|nr:hypothetical protein MBOU_28100 [Mycobacterium bourgelatii]
MAGLGGHRAGPQDLRRDLLCGAYGPNAAACVECYLLMVNDGAVRAMSFSENPPEGRRRY